MICQLSDRDLTDKKTVVFKTHLHCESCKAKVEKNLPFEKGIKEQIEPAECPDSGACHVLVQEEIQNYKLHCLVAVFWSRHREI